MKNYLIISQGSQSIHFIRELFSMGIKPTELQIITLKGDFNLSYLEFLKYYKIEYSIVNKSNFDNLLLDTLNIIKWKLIISFSNPFIIKKEALEKNTFINFHPGILPFYKGSLSTVWSMINGEEYVGGTWHYVDDKVDSGNILKYFKIPIKNCSSAFSLNHQIFAKGISDFISVLNMVNNKNSGTKQIKGGRFYFNKFPNLDLLNLDPNLIERINYFPPNFKN